MARKNKIDTLEDMEASDNGQTTVDVPVKKKRRVAAVGKVAKALRELMEAEKKPIEIKSGTLSGLFCKYTYDHTVAQNTTNEVTCKSQVPVHDDLTASFKKLHVHLAVICEEIHPDDIDDIDDLPEFDNDPDMSDEDQIPLALKLSKFGVSSFKIVGNGENEGIVLTGQKLLSTKDAVQLTTPVTKYFSEYAFVNELRIAIDDVVGEIEAYMNGKQAPPRQTEMEFGGDGSSEIEFENEEDQ